MKNNDLDFLKNKIDQEAVAVPDELNEEAVVELLKDKGQKAKIKLYNRKGFKALVGLVACFAIVICSLSIAVPKVREPKTIVAYGDELSTFRSFVDIKKAVDNDNRKNTGFNISFDAFNYKGEIMYEATADGVTSASTNENYSTTNVQVEGVDEADYIKNDGKHIFAYNFSDNIIKIYEPENGKAKLVSTIDDFQWKLDEYGWVEGECECRVVDMFICGDKLIINGNGNFRRSFEDYNGAETAVSYIYDVSDIANPKRIKGFSQDGAYTNARLSDGQLYVVSSKNTWDTTLYETPEDYAPCCSVDGVKQTIAPGDIAYIENGKDTGGFLVVSRIDVSTCEKTSNTRAIYGCGNTIYCNKENMYIAIPLYDKDVKIQLVKVELLKDKIVFSATTKFNGYINDQFSMDEYNGYFRVSYTDEGKNYVAAFDGKLNLVGKTEPFAEDENIMSTRFMGDYAYVITFMNTDPLFVIDLSNPKKPIIKGNVEITGFSSQLTPVDENTILGIGYISETLNDEWQEGIKLVLFDVSDKENPKVLHSKKLPEYFSKAQDDHHAISIDKENGRYAIDFSSFGENVNESGAFTFEIKDNKIEITNKFVLEKEHDSSRCTFLDNYVYVIDEEANLTSFKY